MFEMFSTTPLNGRNQIVQDRWKLTQRVAKHLVDNRCISAQFLDSLKTEVMDAQKKADCPRAVKQLVPVDHLSRDCPLVKAKRARVRSLPAPMCDVHWSTQCDILLQQIVEKQATFSSDSPEETHSQETPKTPARSKRATITDFFSPASQSSSTHSSSVPHTPTSAPRPHISIKNFFTPSCQSSDQSPTSSHPPTSAPRPCSLMEQFGALSQSPPSQRAPRVPPSAAPTIVPDSSDVSSLTSASQSSVAAGGQGGALHLLNFFLCYGM